MSIEQTLHYMRIAELAILHQAARRETAAAKYDYHIAWKRYETGDECYGEEDHRCWVSPDERITKYSREFESACEATKSEFDTYKAKKRVEYNLKRRLENSIRGAA